MGTGLTIDPNQLTDQSFYRTVAEIRLFGRRSQSGFIRSR